MKKFTILFLLSVLIGGLSNGFGQVNLDSGLVAKYYFNGNANDESGNGNDGTVNGASLTTDRFGNVNSAYSFDGVSNFIDIADNASLRPQKVTVAAWIKLNSQNGLTPIFYKQMYEVYALSSNGLDIKQNSGCVWYDGTGWQYFSFTAPKPDIAEWCFVLGSFDGTNLKFYQNGVLISDTTGLPSTNIDNCAGGSFKIGRWHDLSSEFFNGTIDDIRVYNRALNEQEIQALYLEGQSISATITIPDTIQNITQTVELPVNTSTLNTSDNIISYQFNLAYDETKLQYSNADVTGTIADGGTVVVNNSTAGQLEISYMTTTPLSGEGAILNLQFNPLQIDTSELIISDFLYNTDTITDTQNGVVTIIGDYGDIDTNSYVQAYDAALALQYSVGLDPLPITDPTPWENWRVIVGNVDGVDTITANDASLILQHSAGLISTFPVEGSKSLEDPIADITITQDNDELVFTSTGDLFGLNIYSTNGTAVTMNNPTVSDPNMLSALNINGTTYNVGLCTAYTPSDNTEIMRIPLTCSGNEELTFNMIVNKNISVKSYTVDCSLVGITEATEKEVNIYPNPANETIIIDGLQAGKIEIINLQGQVIKNIDVSNEKTSIDISKLSGGVYTMKIKTNEGIIVKKLIKQ